MDMESKDMTLPHTVRFPVFLCNHPEHQETGHEIACPSKDHWLHALQEVRKKLYTNTSATISAPFYHIFDYERKSKTAQNQCPQYPLLSDINKLASTCSFNAQPFAADDIYIYRQLRSEHVLIRMDHCINTLSHSFIRLSRGIFLVQKSQPSDPLEFPSRSSFDQSFQLLENDAVPIDTFSFDALFHDMMQQTQAAAQKSMQSFVPFTYTLGIRFTNPYHNAHDVVVRGKIPLWCQTLLITEYMRQLPILPETTRKGLLPFLKDMEFSFTKLSAVNKGQSYPELTVIFERFAMELCDPQMTWQNKDNLGNSWEETQKLIMNSIVICDIPETQASYITSMANEWAMIQGILLQ